MIHIKKVFSCAAGVFLVFCSLATFAEEIKVGSCPSNIVVERLGEWTAISNDAETVEILRSNPKRTSEVAAAYVADDGSMLEVVVLSLKGLESFQGGVSESDFNVLRAQMAKAFQSPSVEMQRKINKIIEDNLSGTGASMSHIRYETPVLSLGQLIGFSIVEANIPGLGTGLYETAMKMQHIRGCIVQANFSIAVSRSSRLRLDKAIADFVMR